MIDRRALAAAAVGLVGLAAGVTAAALGSAVLAVVAGATALVAASIAVRLVGDLDGRGTEVRLLSARLEEARHALEAAEQRSSVEHLTQRAAPPPPAADDGQPLGGVGRSFGRGYRAPLAIDVDPALVDQESGLLGGSYFAAAIEDRLAAARRHLRPVTVVLADLAAAADGGPPLAAEEAALVGRLLRRTLRESDTTCRLNDGRFAWILEDTSDTSAVWAVERVRRAIQVELPMRLRAGIASYPTHGLTAAEVLDHAAGALMQAQAMGHDGIQVARVD